MSNRLNGYLAGYMNKTAGDLYTSPDKRGYAYIDIKQNQDQKQTQAPAVDAKNTASVQKPVAQFDNKAPKIAKADGSFMYLPKGCIWEKDNKGNMLAVPEPPPPPPPKNAQTTAAITPASNKVF